MKIYIIQSIGWEYNDEYYYRHEDESGTPKKAYKTAEKAEEECLKLNISTYDQISSSSYKNISHFIASDDLEEEVKEELEQFGCKIQDCDFTPPANATDEVKLNIMRTIGAVFYEIVPIELE